MEMGRDGFSEEEVLQIARRAYREGVAGFEIARESCALLVIDLQDEFVKPGWTPYWVPEATRQIPRVKRLIEHCRGADVPVVYTVFSATHGYLDRPKTGSAMPNRYPEVDFDQSGLFVEGRVWHEIAPIEGEVVIHKPSYGAFYDMPLETILKGLGKDTIIICGTLTNFCCGTTARQGYERGFKVVFGSDVTSTDDPEMQEAELMVLRKGFARVMTSEKIIALL